MIKRQKILEKLKLSKWSVRCNRLQDFMDVYNVNIDNVDIITTSDYHFAGRKHTAYPQYLYCVNIGATRPKNAYYIYACVK
jgi:hypothetical protein